MLRSMLAAAAALTVATAAHAVEPRAVAGKVADQIAANYFDPKRGAEIAAELKAEAAKGAYDRYAQPLDLAQALTTRLRPLDGHFAVDWRPGPPPARPTSGPPPSSGAQALSERRANYGFHQVTVLQGNVGLIDMRYFADLQGADSPSRATVDAAMALVAGADAVIFDLRQNGGGSPGMVGYLVSHFVPAGAPIYNTFKGRGPDTHETPPIALSGAPRLTTPVFVLTSARTASAAEAFAYTLKAAKRATIVGEASAGAANPGDMIPAGDGFSVFVPFGKPVNPITKSNWEGVGVTPDVEVPAAQALERAHALALKQVLAAGLPEPAATETKWALEALEPPGASGDLQAYAGAYGSRTVTVEGDHLLVRQGRRMPVTLAPIAPDMFAAQGTDRPLRVMFERDAGGRITGMVQSSPEGSRSRFARVG